MTILWKRLVGLMGDSVFAQEQLLCCLTEREVERKWINFRIWLMCAPVILGIYALVGIWGEKLSISWNLSHTFAGQCLAVMVVSLVSFAIYSFYYLVCSKGKDADRAQENSQCQHENNSESQSGTNNGSDDHDKKSSRPRTILLTMSFFVLFIFFVDGIILFALRTMASNWWLLPASIYLMWSLGGVVVQELLLGHNLLSHPLENEPLTKKLYEVADEAGFPLVELHQISKDMDFSDKPLFVAPVKKTHRVFFTSLVLDNLSVNQLLVVFAHELGHLEARHLRQRAAVKSFIFVFRWFLVGLIIHLTVGEQASAFILLSIISALHVIFGLVEPIFEGAFSRYCERQADLYALELTRDATSFGSAFSTLIDSLPGGRLDSFLIRLYATHPPLHKRIAFAQEWQRTNVSDSDLSQTNFEPV